MRILLVAPEFPLTYWAFQYSLPLAGKRASLPPLGLISLAALFPRDWDLKLIDLNVGPLCDDDILWSDLVLVGGMHIQTPSMHEVIKTAKRLGRRTLVGGPAPTTCPEEFSDADHIFQGEAEGQASRLIEMLEGCENAPRILSQENTEKPAMALVPVPRFDLLDLRQYASMSIQYSRGCPFNCEFCDIIEIFGRHPRTKAPEQVLGELNALYDLGFRGSVFFVDDNFIGNKHEVSALLPQLIAWQASHDNPFEFYTEASINLAGDKGLMQAMVQAGFTSVFVGIETPSKEALAEVGKNQNIAVDLVEAIDTLTRNGLEVMGGFIVGFDRDTEGIFELQQEFISKLPIPLAMVGMLTCLPGTALWRRLEQEGRILTRPTGDQFDRPNFRPRMTEEVLISGYARLLSQIYSPEAYIKRCLTFLKQGRPRPTTRRVTRDELVTFGRTLWRIGFRGQWKGPFWHLLGQSLFKTPALFPWAVTRAVMGEHMVRYTHQVVLPRLESMLAEIRSAKPQSLQ